MNTPFWSIEPILRRLRIWPIKPYITTGGVYVDIGCDDPPLLIDYLKSSTDFCIGLDAEIENNIVDNVEFKQCFIRKTLPIESELAHLVTMLAVLEHLDYPEAIAHELYRIMKPGGTLLLTVPAPSLKPILELMAKLRIVRPEMIAQHKNYFTMPRLKTMFTEAGFSMVSVNTFQLGFNTFLRAIK